ncbi:hypothetical protein ACFFRR_003253 [Megaselia abdita]
MKFLVVLPFLITAVLAGDLGHVVDAKLGHSVPQGSHVVGQHQGHARISQTVIPGPTQVSSHQGPTRVSEQVVGATPAVSHYKNTHATQINTQHHRTDTLHTQHETPVTTLTQTRHFQPESHTTQHHSSSRSTSIQAVPRSSTHVTTQRKSELITQVNPHHHDGHDGLAGGDAIISDGHGAGLGAGIAHGAGIGAHGAGIGAHGAGLASHGAGIGAHGLSHGAGHAVISSH